MMDYPEPTIYAAPFFVATVIVEAVISGRSKKKDLVGYEKRDTWASLAMGVGSLVTVTAINLGVFVLANLIWPYRLTDLGGGVLAWTVALVGWDFLYYWHHRLEHECRLFWASHVNHHSSRHFNLSTALRQPWTPFTSMLFFPPLAFIGVKPWMIMFAGGINLIYQYWVHTELIGKLPRWFEFVFNTPSHHRVHHGANPEYLDKNYGGILIIWDRLFKSFEEEKARVVFGLTKNITSFNPFVIAFHEYVAIARDVVRPNRSLYHRLSSVLRGPGWKPPAG